MTEPMIPKLTLDTNCVVGLFDSKSCSATSVDELQEIMRYAVSGVVTLVVTTRAETDLSRDKNDQRRAEMMRYLAMLPVIGTIARWEQFSFGPDVLADARQLALLDEIRMIVFPGLTPGSSRYPNKIADIDHLVGHKLAGRDIFVTDDRGILSRYVPLRDSAGILVMKPAEALRYVDAHFARHKKKSLEPSGQPNHDYWDRRFKGEVTFDYSRHDHRFSIGEGLFLFETQWSTAGQSSIHAYRDPPSIEGIALARDACEIENITDASRYDFSTREQSPALGQIVVWRNINGLYAATKILGIDLDLTQRRPPKLNFRFAIIENGSTDFSDK